ncbi:hypothetical protein SeMB42_g05250 [Synchytrium endobioticum]|uniref:FAR1 domain-containing protein n=1 Tax=Synchytrium endobioticum TaxID=286115 RepID=A0A507CT62_9FUNG|nr:hypothetical protein SeMB42_g05250 [Synchytrium endobioticum]TPX42295.1 hypothetical protein SeLEV6574_g05678 [Synchytrium endobioticum]
MAAADLDHLEPPLYTTSRRGSVSILDIKPDNQDQLLFLNSISAGSVPANLHFNYSSTNNPNIYHQLISPLNHTGHLSPSRYREDASARPTLPWNLFTNFQPDNPVVSPLVSPTTQYFMDFTNPSYTGIDTSTTSTNASSNSSSIPYSSPNDDNDNDNLDLDHHHLHLHDDNGEMLYHQHYLPFPNTPHPSQLQQYMSHAHQHLMVSAAGLLSVTDPLDTAPASPTQLHVQLQDFYTSNAAAYAQQPMLEILAPAAASQTPGPSDAAHDPIHQGRRRATTSQMQNSGGVGPLRHPHRHKSDSTLIFTATNNPTKHIKYDNNVIHPLYSHHLHHPQLQIQQLPTPLPLPHHRYIEEDEIEENEADDEYSASSDAEYHPSASRRSPDPAVHAPPHKRFSSTSSSTSPSSKILLTYSVETVDGAIDTEPFTTRILDPTFADKDAAIEYLKDEAKTAGFSVLVRTSKKDYVVLICNCGRRLKPLKAARVRNRKQKTPMTGCSWRIVLVKGVDNMWSYRASNEMAHNHGPIEF